MDSQFLYQIALILICTKIFGLVTRKINLPQVVGALVAGIMLGPAVFGLIYPNDMLTYLSEIGVIILMFNAGMETDFKQLRKSLKSSLVVAVVGVVVPLAGGTLLAIAFGGNMLQSFFIGVILTATSVSITVETLNEMGKLNTPAGTAILGAAVIDDILGIIILTVMIKIGDGGGISFWDTVILLFKIAAFFAIALAISLCIFKLFEHLNIKYGRKRRISIFALGFCFFLAYIAEMFGVADITGAYIAGIALCSSKCVEYIENRSNILSYLFFTPVFFMSVGLKTSFNGMTGSVALFTALLLLVAVVTKIFGCGLGAKICGYTNRQSIQVGAGMVSRGEVALIVANRGIMSGLMEERFFSGVIIVVIITTLITPILLKFAFRSSNNSNKSMESTESTESEEDNKNADF